MLSSSEFVLYLPVHIVKIYDLCSSNLFLDHCDHLFPGFQSRSLLPGHRGLCPTLGEWFMALCAMASGSAPGSYIMLSAE